MAANQKRFPGQPVRAVVLGAGGFIGGAAAARLRSGGVEVAALGRSSCDLLAPEAAADIGRRGGEKVSQDRQHMAKIGKKGGESR